MNQSFRGSSIGLLSGAIASTAFLATLHDGLWSLLLGSAIGVAYCGSLRPTRRAYADNLMSGGSNTCNLHSGSLPSVSVCFSQSYSGSYFRSRSARF
jgi:hypothetical protein